MQSDAQSLGGVGRSHCSRIGSVCVDVTREVVQGEEHLT